MTKKTKNCKVWSFLSQLENVDNFNVKYKSCVWGDHTIACTSFAIGHVWGEKLPNCVMLNHIVLKM